MPSTKPLPIIIINSYENIKILMFQNIHERESYFNTNYRKSMYRGTKKFNQITFFCCEDINCSNNCLIGNKILKKISNGNVDIYNISLV